MPKENHRARKMEKPGEIGGASFVASDEAPGVLQPREEALDFPPPFVAPQGTAILGEVDAITAMRGNEFDIVGGEFAVEPVAVVGGIADQP